MQGDRRAAVRVFDAVFGFLMRPRVRRIRRWSFLVTLPGGVLIARGLDLELTAGLGVEVGLAAVALDLLALAAVAYLGTRVLGRERRDALLDLLMHPVARRAIRTEARVLSTIPRALLRRASRRARERAAEFPYHGRSMELGFALALVPALIAEGVALHLLLPPSWLWPKVVLAALQAYALLMLVSWALAPRACPHRLAGAVLELRAGQLYRASVPLALVAGTEARTERVGGGSGLVLRGEEALLPADGRVDVTLHLDAPVEVERPLGDPVAVTSIAVAVDEPGRLLRALAEAHGAPAPSGEAAGRGERALGWLAPADLLEAAAA